MTKDEMIKDMGTAISKAWGLKYEGGLLVKELMDLGYRKVGEDEIVLTKSEYENLRLAQYNAQTTINENFLLALEKIEQAKKETAREILQYIHNKKLSKAISEKYGIELE